MINRLTLTHISYLALVSAFAGVAVMLVRLINLLSFNEPLQITASGAEYESLYVIWKYINGLTVFADHFKIPFAGTFYNWTYYAFYGEITDVVLKFLNLEDAWIPTITKLVTAIGLVYGTWVTYLCFSLVTPPTPDMARLNLSFALFIFFGPLMGFFGLAAAPDAWALALDVTAIYFFIRYFGDQPLKAILLACLFAYLAWGFKQIFVFTPGIIGLYLLFRREWKWLIVFSAVMWAAWGITLAVGGEQYLKSMLQFGGTKVTLDPERFLRNILNGFPKLVMPVLGLLGITVVYLLNYSLKTDHEGGTEAKSAGNGVRIAWLALLGIVVAGLISIPASAKQGAAENYYFTLSFFMSLALLAGMVWCIRQRKLSSLALSVIAAGWIINLAGVGSVLAGINGKLSNFYIHRDLSADSKCLISLNLPEPVFIANPYLSLPWMYPARQHFVLQTSYPWDREAGVPMERNGLGGLMNQGYFATIVLPGENRSSYDGSSLELYEKVTHSCKGFAIYRRGQD